VFKCEILIVYGHGSGTKPYKFCFPSGGGAVGVDVCFSDKQLAGVDASKILAGQLPTGIQIIWNAPKNGTVRNMIDRDQGEGVSPGDGDALLASLEKSVGDRAKEMCKSLKCKSIVVRYYRNAKPSEKNIPKREDFTIPCDVCK